jgi:hypothetical protein
MYTVTVYGKPVPRMPVLYKRTALKIAQGYSPASAVRVYKIGPYGSLKEVS